MAAIDQLLYFLAENRMNCLELRPAHTPCLRRGNQAWPVSKSTLSNNEILRLLSQIVPKDRSFPPAPPSREMTFEYEMEGMVFSFRAEREEHGWAAAVEVLGKRRELEDKAWEQLMAEREEKAKPISSIVDLVMMVSERGGSDLHLSAAQPPRMRLHGQLEIMHDFRSPSAESLEQLLEEIVPPANREEFLACGDTDFAYQVPGLCRYRVNVFRDQNGPSAVLRAIPLIIPSAHELGLAKEICRLAQLSKGLVLVTGPTGSGKSTTLAAMVDIVNRTRTDHIVTIEDPIEFVHRSRRCLVHQRQVGMHTKSFKSALRAALREDPDVVLVGEMRDLETIAIALETAETGHLVFGTLHTTTAVSTVDRIVDQFPPGNQEQIRMMLSETLRAVVCQTLLSRNGGGRVAAREVLMVTPAVAHLIREGKTHQIASVIQTGKAEGMALLNDSLLDLVKRGLVAPREAYLKSVHRDELLKRMKGLDLDTSFMDFLDDSDPDRFEHGGAWFHKPDKEAAANEDGETDRRNGRRGVAVKPFVGNEIPAQLVEAGA